MSGFGYESTEHPVRLVGGAVLVLYGIITNPATSYVGRWAPRLGGTFIVLTILWDWKIGQDRARRL